MGPLSPSGTGIRLPHLAVLALAPCLPPGGAVDGVREIAPPTPAAQREAWRVVSLLEDAGLERRALFHVDFDPDGTAWAASSDGLWRSDGYDWERFGREHGLPSDYVRCVRVAPDGRLWVGTDRGAGTFDGERYDDAGSIGRLAGPSVRRITADPDGSVWFSCDRWPDPCVAAGLTRLQDGVWSSYGVADGLPDDYVQDLVATSGGRRFALTPRGLAELVDGRFTEPLETARLPGARGEFWSLVETAPGELLAVSTTDCFTFADGTWSAAGPVPPGLNNPALVRTRDGAVLGLRQGALSEFVRWVPGGFVAATEPFPFTGSDVQQVAEAPDGSVWAVGINLLARWERRGGQWRAYDGLPAPAFADHGGGVWFADEAAVLRTEAGSWWRVPDAAGPLVLDGERVWLRHGDGLACWNDGALEHHDAGAVGLPEAEPVGTDGAGAVWVRAGTAPPRLARWDGRAWQRLDLRDPLPDEEFQEAATDPRGGLWVITGDGRTHRVHRVTTDGWSPEPLPPETLGRHRPHLFVDDGGIWAHGFFGLFRRGHDEPWSRAEGLPGGHVFGLREIGGSIWCGYLGTTGGEGGLAVLSEEGWRHYAVGVRGLAGGTPEGPLFFSTRAGLYVVDRHAGPGPSRLALPVPNEVTSAVAGPAGDLWLESIGRVLHFEPDGVPPETFVSRTVAESSAGEEVRLAVRAAERFGPRVRHGSVLVETRVDGGPWTDAGVLDEGGVRLADLPVGLRHVEIRTVDGGGDVDPTPAAVDVRVHALPWQSRPWFKAGLAAVFVLVAGLAAFGLVARGRLRAQARGLEGTVRRRTRELATSERKYRSLFLESRDAIFVTAADGVVSDANAAALELLGRTDREVQGRPLRTFFDESDALDGLLAAAAAGRPAEGELTREAEQFRARVSASVRRDETGAPAGHQVLARDVTAARRLEERLRQTQKMEAVGRMASGIAHDFNNMLTIILGHAELLGEEVRGNAALERELAIVVQQALRARDLTQTIQTFGRNDASAPSSVRVNDLLAESRELLAPILGKSIELRLELDPAVGAARIDPGRLQQVVVNLAVNARDAMPDGGRLTVTTRADPGARSPEHSSGLVHVTVRDSGTGMDAETREKLFEPFFTTKPRGEGSGLGLATVYGIVAQAGGTVAVESAPGRGAEFRIALPAGTAEAPAAPAPERPAERAPSEGRSLLVVEDETELRALLGACLRSAGFRVDLAADGVEALAAADARGGPWDLVVTDVAMPRLGGRELAERLRRRYPDQLVLFVSGQVDPVAGRRLHVDGPLLRKPFRTSELVARVRELLDGSAFTVGAS